MQSEHTVFQFSPMKVHLYHKTIHLLECRLGKFHIHLYFWFPCQILLSFFALIFIPTSSYHDSKNSSSISHDWLDAKQK